MHLPPVSGDVGNFGFVGNVGFVGDVADVGNVGNVGGLDVATVSQTVGKIAKAEAIIVVHEIVDILEAIRI
jgi:hypothetical protein